MPTKLFDGSTGPLKVSRATATPGSVPKPRPAAGAPRALAAADGRRRAKERPSAPAPRSRVASHEARRPSVATGCGHTADPAWLAALGVRTSVAPLMAAAPLSVQPPALGGGTGATGATL